LIGAAALARIRLRRRGRTGSCKGEEALETTRQAKTPASA